ncbi:glycosyltransferase [Campylobacter sp. 19-13652]|uniref:glycosyltransferase n=1 Tax=Campylobacter sp. 19-13652 TaxID=2840180 RepID=UPI001C73EF78|nr:glycosyltransferase [Campylobacter sp. 19-13652]BCX79812.1 hypothetical protein LBC_12740 [Campylobacter sp. 19-13652]
MKKALVSDWLTTNAGAEKVVGAINLLYPEIDNYALVDTLNESDRKEILLGKRATTSFLQNMPFAGHNFRRFLPLFPYAIEQFDLSRYEVVLSSSHCVAKGVLTSHEQLHICYIHTPMRYAWDMHNEYLANSGFGKFKKAIASYFLYKIRQWDTVSSLRVDKFIANSNFVASRVKKIYNKEAKVIYPPVDIDKFSLGNKSDEYYLTAGRLVSYKKFDLIIKAFNKNKRKLIIIGEGKELENLKKIANKNIEFLEKVDNNALVKTMQNAKAFVFAAKEDFGITPVEAMACGKPVIFYAQGGVTESVRDGIEGIGFYKQNELSLNEAINEFEKNIDCFNPEKIRLRALNFSKDNFIKNMKQEISNTYNMWKDGVL